MMRTRVYRAIVELLSDGRWHWLAEIGEVTSVPDHWARRLSDDPEFELDASRAMIRLRRPAENVATQLSS